jgi:hypothetical protein
MTNQSELDELKSYNTQAVLDAEVRLPAISDFDGDCVEISIGSGFEGRRQLVYKFQNCTIHKANPPTQTTEVEIRVNLPAKAGDKPRASSTLGGMILAMEKGGIGSDATAPLNQRIHMKGKARSLGAEGMSPFWQWEPELAGNSVAGGGVGVAQQQPAEPTAEAIAAVFEIVAGNKFEDVTLKLLKDKRVSSDSAMNLLITQNQDRFQSWAEEQGATVGSDGIYHIEGVG